MRFIYTSHAGERMKKRKIKKFEIEQTILNPERWLYDKDDSQKSHAVKQWSHRTIEIVYISKVDEIKIITAFVL